MAVQRNRNNQSKGLSGIRAEHLCGWLEKARKVDAEAKAAAETTGTMKEGADPRKETDMEK